jgi:high affinity Mn2+ porin
MKKLFVGLFLFILINQGLLWGQETVPGTPSSTRDQAQAPVDSGKKEDRWSWHFQATSIYQHHGFFDAPYEGPNSLPSHPENRVSLTATVFLDFRINSHLDLVVNPEVAGGKGFGEVRGIAGFTNGEIPRVASAIPKLYPARGYIRATWGLGSEMEECEDEANQVAGKRPARRFTALAGKFAVTDFFDNNAYSHDPRTQFMNWAMMYNGAWDYPADTRGYTVGLMEELTMPHWSLRLAQVAEATVANGPRYDANVLKNRGDMVECEWRYAPLGQPGALRILGFANRARSGTFRGSLLPDGTTNLEATRRNGTLKYGFGLNFEQAFSSNIGVFGRYGWNDGKTESWAFTQIDRTVSGGISLGGQLWKRRNDHAGIGAAWNSISGDHRNFLAHGGLGFIIGDGRLDHSRPEGLFETYYSWRILKAWTVTGDFQHIRNPAYNADRGPVSVYSMRLHWER